MSRLTPDERANFEQSARQVDAAITPDELSADVDFGVTEHHLRYIAKEIGFVLKPIRRPNRKHLSVRTSILAKAVLGIGSQLDVSLHGELTQYLTRIAGESDPTPASEQEHDDSGDE